MNQSAFDFLLGVLSSIIASIILLLFSLKISKSAKWVLIGFLARLTNSDLEFVFKNKKDSAPDLELELERAKSIYIFAGRGNELKRDTFSSIFSERKENKKVDLKILLPDPEVIEGRPDWIGLRESEVSKFDSTYGKRDYLRSEISTSIQFVLNHIESERANLRLYQFPQSHRAILTENYLYFTPYLSDRHGRGSVVYKFRRGEMYDYYLRMFNLIWEISKPIRAPLYKLGSREDLSKTPN
jgi:hypothetical protein